MVSLLFAAAIPVYAGALEEPEGIFVPAAEEETSPDAEEVSPEESVLPEEMVPEEENAEQPAATAEPEEASELPSEKPTEQTPEALPETVEEIAALSIATDGLESNEVMVDNFSDLKAVLEDYTVYAGVDTIYLNADITYQAGGIGINQNRTAITIIGHPKGQNTRYSINDITGGQGAVIRVQKSGFSLTVKDAVINGRNYYGAFTVLDAYTGATTSYVNVTYNGPQITYNRRGLVRYIGCSITIANTGGDPPQEVGELAQLEIGGTTTFTNTAGSTSMFWFAGNFGSNQYLKVLDGANVTATHTSASSPYGFIYVEGLGGTANQKPEITIGENASLNVTTRVGFTHTSHRVESVEIRQGGRLSITQTSDAGDYPTIYINSSLTVQQGAALEVQRGANTRSNGLIRFYNAGGTMKLNDPKRVQLYNPYGRVITTRTGTAVLSGTVGALNAWKTDSGYVDSIDNMPANIWNKNDSSSIAMSATITTTGVSAATISNQAADDPFTAEFNNTTFNTYAMPMLTAGSYVLDTDAVYPNDSQITGTAQGNADVKVSYTNHGIPQNLMAEADASGIYQAAVPDTPLAQDMEITVLSHKNYLKARHVTKVLEQPSILRFLSIPEELPFLAGQISALPQLIGRQEQGWAMSIEDTRGAGNTWRIDASVAHPLLGTDGTYTYTLPNALVYVDQTGSPHTLGSAPTTVYSGTTGGSPFTEVGWAADRGLLVSLDGGEGNPNIAYSTTITWTLIDAP